MACGMIPAFRVSHEIDDKYLFGGFDIRLRNARGTVVDHLESAFALAMRFEDGELDALRHSLTHRDTAQRLPGFADLLSLWSAWLPLPKSALNVVENPFPFHVTTMGVAPEARVVWRETLRRKYIAVSDQCKWVLQTYDDWEVWEATSFYKGNQHKGHYFGHNM
jgi:hypothetical protein